MAQVQNELMLEIQSLRIAVEAVTAALGQLTQLTHLYDISEELKFIRETLNPEGKGYRSDNRLYDRIKEISDSIWEVPQIKDEIRLLREHFEKPRVNSVENFSLFGGD